MAKRPRQNPWGILTLSMLGACSGGADPPSERSADSGGFDGGGQIGLGISWGKGVFVQPVWDEGQLRLLVANGRTETVTLGVYEVEFADDAGTRGASLAQSTIPAQSAVAFDGSALLGPPHSLLWISAGDELLGLIERPQPPFVAATLPVVSTQTSPNVQVETDFSLLPGPTFEATVTSTSPGYLWLEPSTSIWMHVDLLTPTQVTSNDATVISTPKGFRVALPHDTSQEAPARVQLSFALPQDLLSADTVLMIDAGFLCTDQGPVAIPREPNGSDECVTGARIGRLLPAP